MKVSVSSLLCVVVVALSLANVNHGIEIEVSSTTSISFSTLDATTDTYKTFLNQLRQKLSVGANRVYDVPVLSQSVPDSKRFISIDLTNSFNTAITLAIDVVDVKVVAYLTSGKSYFFPDAPNSASESLFSDSQKHVLNFSSSFQSIELAAGTTRLKTPLGPLHLNLAIDNLYHYRRETVPLSFLVVIQMISEASKFKFIEQSVRNSIRDGKEFTPGLAIVSLEDNWSTLSTYIQTSSNLQGLFPNTIQLYNSKDEPIIIDSIYYPIIFSNIALMQHYQCHSKGNDPIPKLIRMVNDNDDPCQVQNLTTRIRSATANNYCLSVIESPEVGDGLPADMMECGGYKREQWTFHRDGTIQCFGKCLSKLKYIPDLLIFDCDKAGPQSTTWKLNNDGSISNPNSNLYLDYASTKIISALNKSYTTNQVWRVGNNEVDPIVTTIIGFKEKCLEAIESSDDEQLRMENCVKDKSHQEWALFNDGTIRINSDREWCVSTTGTRSKDAIDIRYCDGSPNQSWIFKADGSIFNPVSGLIMDVTSKNKIILYQFNNNNNQKWIPFY